MATQLRAEPVEPVHQSKFPSGLVSVRERTTAVSIWQRQLAPQLTSALGPVERHPVDTLGLAISLPMAAEELPDALIECGYDAHTASLLSADIISLAHRFSSICGARQLKIRLEWLETDACWKWHADYVTYRLLTTYFGQGTQWILAEEPDAVTQMCAGDVGIFKGRLLIENPPVLHRSPPITATDEKRLLLVIDPVIAD